VNGLLPRMVNIAAACVHPEDEEFLWRQWTEYTIM